MRVLIFLVLIPFFLRPTESLILFLQQFGRGLRIHENKSHLTVLDFIAPQHRNFNFAKRYQALSSRPSLRIDKQIESDMPYVPPACLIYLEKQAKEHVLNNIRSATANLRGEKLLSELRELRRVSQGDISLKQILDYLNLDHPDVLYKRGLPHILLANADNRVHHDLTGFDEDLSKDFDGLRLWMILSLLKTQSDLLALAKHSANDRIAYALRTMAKK